MTHEDLEASIRSENRRKRRQFRRERIAKLLGLVLGMMFGARWFGWILAAGIIAIGLVLLSRIL